MQRSSKTNGRSKHEQFQREPIELINEGIHGDLAESESYLEKYELKNYIKKDNNLDVAAIDANHDLTVRQVLEIGAHYARWATHKNLHEALETVGQRHEVLSEGSTNIKDIKDVSELPPEIQAVLGDILGDILKGRGKNNGRLL